MMRKIIVIWLVSALCISLASCTEADIVICRGQRAIGSVFPKQGTVAITVNLSSGRFHTDAECRHAVNTKEENKKVIFYRDAREALDEGFEPCSVCAGEYKTTEENDD